MSNFSNAQPAYQAQAPMQTAGQPVGGVNVQQFGPPSNPNIGYMPQSPVSAVNINIINPTANGYGMGAMQQPVMPLYPQGSVYPGNAPPVSYPQNYNNNFVQTKMNMDSEPAPKVANTEQKPAEEKTETKKTKKDDDKNDKKKSKVLLTDDYIKSLENYLNNESPKIRLMAASELLERFKEDDKRKTDIALTALLNKALQDNFSTVRLLALTTLDTGYAAGNLETAEILKQIQQKGNEQYGEDTLLASQILLKMSGQRVDVPSKEEVG